MSDREILRQASDNSDDWSDETWAAWGRLADQAHGRESVPALLAEVERLRAERSELNQMIRSSNLAAVTARAERDRFRSAWQSARFRAEARGEGILREAKNRDFWQEEAHRLGAELAARPSVSPQVWLLMQGEDHEGGNVLGVYATRAASRGGFIAAARRLHFEIDGAEEREGGSLHLHAGCDWLSLTPHAMTTAEAIEAGEDNLPF
ncbi:hypothetical protein ABZ694_24985 [Streptomyces albidoflavus]|uniref:hypothetical protein n=1 Tax=Streptomyces albidoflavus TaxID=1886 RepID=UPI0033C6BCD0